MYQVILNLLSNAIKYSPKGGDVGIKVAEKDNFLDITIWDKGIGISQADLPMLFQPFQRIETVLTKNIPGTGLGLNYSKKLVELHGGKIIVESEEGKGSHFHILLEKEFV